MPSSIVRLISLVGLALGPSLAAAQDTTSTSTAPNSDELLILTGEGSYLLSQPATPTGPYTTYDRITLVGTNFPSGYSESGSLSGPVPTGTSDGDDYLVITGRETTTTFAGNMTSTSTSTEPQPTNTTPCNNYVEFCNRKYSNITNIACHNSPFVRPGNAGSNQALPVLAQLNDGVRFLQAQIRFPEGSNVPHFCHTTCDLLDAGVITDWLTTVEQWVEQHPYDVVTILLGNGNFSEAEAYVSYIEASGITKWTYKPTVFPMELEDWPTLAELIIRGNRVVMFMDYNANQEKYPWLLDQFSQMWETPFNPMDRDFPCDIQRPEGLKEEDARKRLYMHNHNLNVEYNLFGGSIRIPAVSLLNETNADSGYGSLGLSAKQCVADWDRPPNFLNVDYYNYGNYPGSVFEVAAQMNNVTYDRERAGCCGNDLNAASSRTGVPVAMLVAVAAALLVL